MKRTLVTVVAMVSACVVFVGVVSLVAVTVVSRVVRPADGVDRDPGAAPVQKVDSRPQPSAPLPRPQI